MLLGCKLLAILLISIIYGSELTSFMTTRETPEKIDTIEKLDNAVKNGLRFLNPGSNAQSSILAVSKLVQLYIQFCCKILLYLKNFCN